MKLLSKIQRGQGLPEYALLLALIALVVVAALLLIGPSIGDKLREVGVVLRHVEDEPAVDIGSVAANSVETSEETMGETLGETTKDKTTEKTKTILTKQETLPQLSVVKIGAA